MTILVATSTPTTITTMTTATNTIPVSPKLSLDSNVFIKYQTHQNQEQEKQCEEEQETRLKGEEKEGMNQMLHGNNVSTPTTLTAVAAPTTPKIMINNIIPLPHNCNQIMKSAEIKVRHNINKSHIFNQINRNNNNEQQHQQQQNDESAIRKHNKPFDNTPKVDESELIIGKLLGHGGFCVVHEVSLIAKSLSRSSSCYDRNSRSASPESIISNNTDEFDIHDNHHHHHLHFISALRKQNNMKKDNYHFRPTMLLKEDISQGTYYRHTTIHQKDDYNLYIHHHHKHHVDKLSCPYAMKRIKPELYQYNTNNSKATSRLVSGISDLIIETYYLSILNHSHIIQVRAISNVSPYDYHHYYILLDKLSCMLPNKIDEWKSNPAYYHHPNAIRHLLFDYNGHKEQASFYIRLKYAYDIATAIAYLHQNNIMYRDIKADNIGFDMMDEIKLTDFGLIKEFDPNKRNVDGLFYNISDVAGSYYYMDPRVALRLAYNESCDVYSFCILLWQILELEEQPFEYYNLDMLRLKVYVLSNDGDRPIINRKWSKNMQDMLSRGWSYDYKIRPTMNEICHILSEEMYQYYQRDYHHHHHHVIPDSDDDDDAHPTMNNNNNHIKHNKAEIEL